MRAIQSTALATAAGALLALTACTEVKRPPPQPPLVTVAKPEKRNVEDAKILVGTTKSTEEVEVRARVQGFLESIRFVPATNVKKDQVLFTIEKSEFESAVASAVAAVDRAKAELTRAQADYERVEQAAKTNAVSKSEVSLRLADRDKADANVKSAEAALTTVRIDLSYTDVLSPIDGRASRNRVDVGNLVGAGDRTLLTTVVKLDPLYVYFDVPETWLVERLRNHSARVQNPEEKRENFPISIALEGDKGYPYEGWIDYIDNTVDPDTGTIQARGVLPNPELKMYPGLFARVRIAGETLRDAVLVREDAIGTDLGGKFVLVIGEGNVVERRYVELGPADGEFRAVLEGLSHDDSYIVEGLVRARPGLPVRTQAAQASAPAAGGEKPPATPPPADPPPAESPPATPPATPGGEQ